MQPSGKCIRSKPSQPITARTAPAARGTSNDLTSLSDAKSFPVFTTSYLRHIRWLPRHAFLPKDLKNLLQPKKMFLPTAMRTGSRVSSPPKHLDVNRPQATTAPRRADRISLANLENHMRVSPDRCVPRGYRPFAVVEAGGPR